MPYCKRPWRVIYVDKSLDRGLELAEHIVHAARRGEALYMHPEEYDQALTALNAVRERTKG